LIVYFVIHYKNIRSTTNARIISNYYNSEITMITIKNFISLCSIKNVILGAFHLVT